MDWIAFSMGTISGFVLAYVYYLMYEHQKELGVQREKRMIENVAKTLEEMENQRRIKDGRIKK